jgi:hypothetical protein
MKKFKRSISTALALTLLLTLFGGFGIKASASSMTYKQVVTPQYEDAGYFSEGLAPVKSNGLWGYIDTTGKTVIDFQYYYAYTFSEGRAVVVTKEEAVSPEDNSIYYNYCYGFVDHTGKYTPFVMPGYDENWNFDFNSTETTQACSGIDFYEYEESEKPDYFKNIRACFVNGYIILPCVNPVAFPEINVIFNARGKAAAEYYNKFAKESGNGSTFAQYEPYSFVGENGYVPYSTVDGTTYVNLKSSTSDDDIVVKIPDPDTQCAAGLPFNQGMAGIFIWTWDDASTYFGIVDQSGNWIIKPQYSNYWAGIFNGELFAPGVGIASVKNQQGLYGGINKAGGTVIPFEYEHLDKFNEGLAAFCKNGKYGYMDTTGKVVINAQYDDATGFNGGFAVVLKNGSASLIDTKGNLIEGSKDIDASSYIVIDSNGTKTVHSPGTYTIIKVNGKYGFGCISFTPDMPTEKDVAVWALPEVTSAITNNLVPTNLQNQYYSDITRADFASLAVAAVEVITGKDIKEVVLSETGKSLYTYIGENPFIDTSSSDIIAAYALGLVNGTGNNRYNPYASIIRQDAATLLMRLASFFDQEGGTDAAAFDDSTNISSYATAGVNYVCSLGIMNGTGDNKFSPRDTYTRQQAFVTMSRIFKVISEA